MNLFPHTRWYHNSKPLLTGIRINNLDATASCQRRRNLVVTPIQQPIQHHHAVLARLEVETSTNHFRYGVVANISRSHLQAEGLVPRSPGFDSLYRSSSSFASL
ncbi:Transcription initiation factor TFIID subunit 5 [Fusarium oxysporum f. sp. albedinis]|nr:Transcription initiation factor TFIID subunit 5 [Fusarium oxysporum f. sp. albedinis]